MRYRLSLGSVRRLSIWSRSGSTPVQVGAGTPHPMFSRHNKAGRIVHFALLGNPNKTRCASGQRALCQKLIPRLNKYPYIRICHRVFGIANFLLEISGIKVIHLIKKLFKTCKRQVFLIFISHSINALVERSFRSCN